MIPKRKKGILISPAHMPKDVYAILLRVQGETKNETLTQFSLENTIYKIIRAYGNN